MEWLPAANAEVVKVAIPPAPMFAVPSDVAPSKNSTAPVPGSGVTVAVKVTGVPAQAGLVPDVSVTVCACKAAPVHTSNKKITARRECAFTQAEILSLVSSAGRYI